MALAAHNSSTRGVVSEKLCSGPAKQLSVGEWFQTNTQNKEWSLRKLVWSRRLNINVKNKSCFCMMIILFTRTTWYRETIYHAGHIPHMWLLLRSCVSSEASPITAGSVYPLYLLPPPPLCQLMNQKWRKVLSSMHGCKLLETKLLITILLQAKFSSLPPLPSQTTSCLRLEVLFLFHLFTIPRDGDVSRNPGQNQQIYHHANDSKLHAEWILQSPSTFPCQNLWSCKIQQITETYLHVKNGSVGKCN